jgi:hypothetical protein
MVEFVLDLDEEALMTPGREEEELSEPSTPGRKQPAPQEEEGKFSCQVPQGKLQTFQPAMSSSSCHSQAICHLHQCSSCPFKATKAKDCIKHGKKMHGGKCKITTSKIRNQKYLSLKKCPPASFHAKSSESPINYPLVGKFV